MEHQPDSSPENQPESTISPEAIRELRDYINNGAALIVEGKYAQAIEHFESSDELAKVGWKMGSPQIQMLKKIPSPEETEQLSHYIATNSSSGGGTIELSKLYFTDSLKSSADSLPIELLHEISLIYLEEWLHALQEITGRNLCGTEAFEKVTAEAKEAIPENEIDVVLYLNTSKVPLTKHFLHRYNRNLLV